MKQIIQRRVLAINTPKSPLHTSRFSAPRASSQVFRNATTSLHRQRGTGRRPFHDTAARKAEEPPADPKKGPLPKSANLDTSSSGTYGNGPQGASSVPQGLLGMGPVVLTLGLVFVSCAAWFGYRYYRATTVYPSAVRSQIRLGLRAMIDGDLDGAELALRRAWAIAGTLPPDTMGEDPFLKLSGISIQLAECLERAKKRKAAYEVYMQTLPDFFDQFAIYSPAPGSVPERHPGWKIAPLTGKGRLRAVGIANRAAMLAQELQGTGVEPPPCEGSTTAGPPRWTKSWEESEMYLRTFAVTQMLHLVSHTTGIPTAALSTSPDLDGRLPTWLRRIDMAAPCEALADCYVRRGEIELALPLYQTSYYFLLSRPVVSAASSISLTSPLSFLMGTPPDPTTMCIAASVLTAMSAAALGIDNPRDILRNKSPNTSSGSPAGGDPSKASIREARLQAVRSWARESRYLVDLGRRGAGGRPYVNSMAGIDILGREDDKPEPGRENSRNSKSQEASKRAGNGDVDLAEKDKRLVKLDLERIREAERRLGDSILEGRVSSSSKMTVNPTCEHTWAVVLYNTGMVELMDGNKSLAEEYLQLALEHSRRTGLIEGVARSKAVLKNLLSTEGKGRL